MYTINVYFTSFFFTRLNIYISCRERWLIRWSHKVAALCTCASSNTCWPRSCHMVLPLAPRVGAGIRGLCSLPPMTSVQCRRRLSPSIVPAALPTRPCSCGSCIVALQTVTDHNIYSLSPDTYN